MNEDTMYHIHLTKEQGAGYALLTGDPGRVSQIAGHLDRPAFLAQNREYVTWEGSLHGARVLVISTGIGGPSAAIALEELHKIGVHTILRIGTCGGMQSEVLAGDLILASGAVRMDGTSREYAPLSFPAVADYAVLSALHDAAREAGYRAHTGVVQSKDSFYGQHSPASMPIGKALSDNWIALIQSGVLASEMECATLFTVAAVRRIRAGAVLLTVWNQELASAGLHNDTEFDTERAARLAVCALGRLMLADRQKTPPEQP